MATEVSNGNGQHREPDIYVVGLGIKGIEHVTRETEAAFRRSNEILAVATHPAVLSYLESMGPKVTNLQTISYREDEHRLGAYDTMAASVLAAALEHPPVTFALYGHPMIYVLPSRQVLHAAPYLGLKAEVQPGISSLDTIFCDLGIDPASDGLQMYEATDLLLRRRRLQPDVPCLLWQVGAVESALYSTAASRPERFSRIKEYLLEFYPPEHELIAVYSSQHPLLDPTLTRFKLGEMEDHHYDLHQGLTVYIPPVRLQDVVDKELARKIESQEHLATLVHPHAEATSAS
jgi:uncharacterized protein YabN with tetrapyrrole methylase and pyrophosphatase domain